MSHFGESKFNKKKADYRKAFFYSYPLPGNVSLDVKNPIAERREKTVSYLVCQTVCVFCIDTMFSAQPNMVVLPNLTWLSLKQAGTMAHDCFLLRHTDWYYV